MLNVKKTLTKVLEMLKTAKGDDGTWKTLNSSVAYSKKAGVAFAKGSSSGSVSLTNGQWNNLGTLPSGYRPNSDVYFVAQDRSNCRPMMGRVATSGIISVYPENGGCYYWLYIVSFPVVGGVIRQLLSTLATAFVRKGVAVC